MKVRPQGGNKQVAWTEESEEKSPEEESRPVEVTGTVPGDDQTSLPPDKEKQRLLLEIQKLLEAHEQMSAFTIHHLRYSAFILTVLTVILELLNQASDVGTLLFVYSKTAEIPFFYASAGALCLTVLLRLMELGSHIYYRRVASVCRYIPAAIVYLIEPNSGLRLVQGALKQKKVVKGAFGYQTASHNAAHENDAALLWFTIRSILIMILAEDVIELGISAVFVAQNGIMFSQAGLLFLVSAFTSTMHLLRQLLELRGVLKFKPVNGMLRECFTKDFKKEFASFNDALDWVEKFGSLCRDMKFEKSSFSIDQILTLVRSCQNVVSLDLKLCSQVDNSGVQELAEVCKFLQSVRLGGTRVDNEGLRFLALRRKHLQSVYLNGTEVDDEGLKYLAENCRKLHTVNLRDTIVSNVGVECLAEHCERLQTVYLSRTRVGNYGVQCLAEHCPHLQTVTLERTTVDDDGVDFLLDFCPDLDSLDLGGTQVTPYMKEELHRKGIRV